MRSTILSSDLLTYLLKALAAEIAEELTGVTDREVVEINIDELQVEDELRDLVCKKLNIQLD